MRKLTHEEFISKAIIVHNNYYSYNNVIYINSKTDLEITCPIHGDFPQSANSHLQGQGCPDCRYITIAEKNTKTHEQFLKELEEVNKIYHNVDNLIFIEKYKGTNKKILCRNEHGLVTPLPINLLEGKKPTIKCAVDPLEYYKSQSRDRNKHYRDGEFDIIGKTNNRTIICVNKHGFHLMRESSLFAGANCNLKTAIDKTAYWISTAKEKYGDKYDYFLVNYVTAKIKLQIKCKEHNNIFVIRQNGHFKVDGGCQICRYEKVTKRNIENPTGWRDSVWEAAAKNSTNFDSFKLYIIKCWNDTETFFKIGKTFVTVEERFGCPECKVMPYKYKLLKEIIGEAKEISDLEDELQRIHKKHKYLPSKQFAGMFECFSKIDFKIIEEKVAELKKKV